MKSISNRFAPYVGMLLLSSMFVAGCSSNPEAKPGGDEMNKGMSAQQKAITAEHKKQADQ